MPNTHFIETKHDGGLAMKTDIDGHSVLIDAKPEVGGEDRGPSPKKLLLNALSGCTAIDVLSMLRKMRVEFSDFSIEIEGYLTEEHPVVYHTININYKIKTDEKYKAKMEKAVSLSVERYCGVSAMLEKAAKLNHTITYL